jgi:calcium/calmodulin-dependent protein kinase I
LEKSIVFKSNRYIYFASELLPGGDLFTYHRGVGNFNVKQTQFYGAQICSVFEYLHSKDICYRDLKPENILMASDDDSADLKIVDFGLSKIIGPNESSLDPFGTLSYVAPEVLLQKPYGKEVDMWSLGVITYLMLSRVLPFDDEDDKEIARQTIQDAPEFNFDPWQDISQEAVEVCKCLLDKNRHKRPSLEQTLNMGWFVDLKVEGLGAGKFKSYAMTKISKESNFLKERTKDAAEVPTANDPFLDW